MNTNLSGRELQDEVTPFSLYANRRRFLQRLGGVGTLAASAGIYRWFNPVRNRELSKATIDNLASVELTKEQRLERGFLVDDWLLTSRCGLRFTKLEELKSIHVLLSR